MHPYHSEQEKWDVLVLVDARECVNNNFKIYQLIHSHKSDLILKMSVNKTETYADHIKMKRRPRVRPDELLTYLEPHMEFIAEGSIEELLDMKKID